MAKSFTDSMANIPTGVLRKLVEARDSLEDRDSSARSIGGIPTGYYLIGIYSADSEYDYHWIGTYEYRNLRVKDITTTISHLLSLLDMIVHSHHWKKNYVREYFEIYRVPERCPERS